jgi:hypothetical protein
VPALLDALSGDFLWRLDAEAHRNPAPNPDPDRRSLRDQDHYRCSKFTWNYYSP